LDGGKVRIRPGRVLVGVGATLISVVLAGLAFFRVTLIHGALRIHPRFDFAAWIERLPSHLPWVIPFVALTATLSALRAIVWGQTLPESERPASWRARFHALALGGLVHNALPGHLGALVSAWVLSRGGGGPAFPAALGSFLLAKALEFGALFGVTSLLALIAHLRGVTGLPVRSMLWAGGVALIVFAVALAGARRFAPPLAARLAARGRLPRLAKALETLASGLTAVHSPRRLVAGWLLALLPELVTALAWGLALRHVGGRGFLLGGGLMVGAVTFSQLALGVPGTMGLYYFICAATARALGVPDDQAAALAVLSHVAQNVAHSLVGIGSAIAHHEGLRHLLRMRAEVRATSS
jgi:Lysylphosphatidylglycerol synthase TM region